MSGKVENQAQGITTTPISIEERRAQVEKVLSSRTFRPAPALRRFLEHVASKSIDGVSNEIKESTVGAEVFGRAASYDPRIDTVVRVEAHRLREKLRKYYEEEGADDDILLSMPKGRYVPHFSRRVPTATPEPELSQATHLSSQAREGIKISEVTGDLPSNPFPGGSSQGAGLQSKRRPFLWISVALAGVTLLLGLGSLIPHMFGERLANTLSRVRSGMVAVASPHDQLQGIWADFLKDGSFPLVVFSDAAFLATQNGDLLRVKKDEDVGELGATEDSNVARRLLANPGLLEHPGPLISNDAYTGTGEVMGVYFLTRVFERFHSSFLVKRSRLLTTDDLSRHDLIFLGSILENPMEGVPSNRDFVFARSPIPSPFPGRILNLHPQPGEPTSYEVERDSSDQAVNADYALISFLPGITPSRKIAVLGGLTTFGTQAAADFATSADQIATLAAKLAAEHKSSGGKMLPAFFQAVLRVEIVRGDILNVKYVAGHTINP